ncbi:MAG: hypothetical protein ACRCRZ_00375 [Metamycoplasmataceae bacterium]
MKYIDLEKNILKTWLFLVSIITLVLVIISFISFTFVTGFILGSLISIIIFGFNYFFLAKLLSKKRKKNNSIFISIIKYLITIVIYVGFILMVVFSNLAYRESYIDGVFNFFCFFAGLITIHISIIVFHFLSYLYKKIQIIKNNKKERK